MNAIEKLQRVVAKVLPQAEFDIDPPQKEEGVWWLDVDLKGHSVVVEWRPHKGFGISSSTEYGYGEGADEVIEDVEVATQRIITLLEQRQRTQSPREMGLKKLREHQEMTQNQVAETMDVGQAAISKIEKRTDMTISTLRRTIEALGGTLEIRAKFPNEVIKISQFDGTTELSFQDEKSE